MPEEQIFLGTDPLGALEIYFCKKAVFLQLCKKSVFLHKNEAFLQGPFFMRQLDNLIEKGYFHNEIIARRRQISY